jgi:hypothetical protein
MKKKLALLFRRLVLPERNAGAKRDRDNKGNPQPQFE